MQALLLYVLAIVAVNTGFAYLPMVPLPDGGVLPSMSLVAGLVFVLRDLAQRQVGHQVLVAMAAGGMASYWLADPRVAVASAVAFAVAELADWAVYSRWRGALAGRVLLSSCVAAPLDTALFLGLAFGAQALSPWSVGAMVVCKLLGALAAFMVLR